MKITRMLILAGHLLLATLVCTVLGTIVQTQFNLAELQQLGVAIPLDVRLKATGADLVGFTPSFGPIVLAGFVIAFAIAAPLAAWRPAWRRAWFLVAGSAAIFVAMVLMAAIFPVTPVAAVRGPGGMAALCLCGGVGGLVFERLRRRYVSQRSG